MQGPWPELRNALPPGCLPRSPAVSRSAMSLRAWLSRSRSRLRAGCPSTAPRWWRSPIPRADPSIRHRSHTTQRPRVTSMRCFASPPSGGDRRPGASTSGGGGAVCARAPFCVGAHRRAARRTPLPPVVGSALSRATTRMRSSHAGRHWRPIDLSVTGCVRVTRFGRCHRISAATGRSPKQPRQGWQQSQYWKRWPGP